MSRTSCKNPRCDRVEAAALQAAGVWDALSTAAEFEDEEARALLQALELGAPRLLEALQALSEEVSDEG